MSAHAHISTWVGLGTAAGLVQAVLPVQQYQFYRVSNRICGRTIKVQQNQCPWKTQQISCMSIISYLQACAEGVVLEGPNLYQRCPSQHNLCHFCYYYWCLYSLDINICIISVLSSTMKTSKTVTKSKRTSVNAWPVSFSPLFIAHSLLEKYLGHMP